VAGAFRAAAPAPYPDGGAGTVPGVPRPAGGPWPGPAGEPELPSHRDRRSGGPSHWHAVLAGVAGARLDRLGYSSADAARGSLQHRPVRPPGGAGPGDAPGSDDARAGAVAP
jgi:hypothetical protein